jgi:hypothetical protein
MKSVRSGRKYARAAVLASALAVVGGSASAAPSLQASPDPAGVGSVFSINWTDSATDPATGFTGFDVMVYFMPATLQYAGSLGSAFGSSTTGVTFDVFGDPSDDPGFALFHIVRNAGAQPTSFGSDILRVDFLVLGPPSSGLTTDITFFPPLTGTPGAGDYVGFNPGGDPTSVNSRTTRVGITATVPEPASLALMLGGLGLLATRARHRRGPTATPVAAVS